GPKSLAQRAELTALDTRMGFCKRLRLAANRRHRRPEEAELALQIALRARSPLRRAVSAKTRLERADHGFEVHAGGHPFRRVRRPNPGPWRASRVRALPSRTPSLRGGHGLRGPRGLTATAQQCRATSRTSFP